MIKVAITDDHPIVIEGLTNVIRSQRDIVLTGTFRNGAELMSGLQEQLPDVLMLDIQMPDKNGSELVPLILKQYPKLNILILSGMESSLYIKNMMQKGCKGYLLKSVTGQALIIEAIRKVHSGSIYLDAGLKEQLLEEMLISKRLSNNLNPNISHREKEVLTLIASGHSNQQIAEILFISQRTAETHRHNLLQKLDVKNTAGLCRLAMDMGLID